MGIFHDLKIVTDEKSTVKHVFIDGVEQKGVVACDIRLRPEEVPTVSLQYVFNSIDAAMSAAAVETTKTFTDGILSKGIEHLDLGIRAYNSIRRGEWDTFANRDFNISIADVVIAHRTGHLKKYKNMGSKSYQEVIRRLKEFGLISEDEE